MTVARKSPRGFTLPLTLALAFGIMSVAAGLTALVAVRAKAARQKDADVFALITLESAVQASLARLERSGAPKIPAWEDSETLNGRRTELVFQAPNYKIDVSKDPADTLAPPRAEPDLKARVASAMTSPDAPEGRASFTRLGEFMRAAQVTPAEEDCLRVRVTFARQAPQPEPPPPPSALPPEMIALAPGDVVEVRAAIRSDRYTDVLWQRLRYSGTPGRPWHIHEWRRLRLAPGAARCRPPSLLR